MKIIVSAFACAGSIASSIKLQDRNGLGDITHDEHGNPLAVHAVLEARRTSAENLGCAIHAVLGEWSDRRRQYEVANIVRKREELKEAITNEVVAGTIDARKYLPVYADLTKDRVTYSGWESDVRKLANDIGQSRVMLELRQVALIAWLKNKRLRVVDPTHGRVLGAFEPRDPQSQDEVAVALVGNHWWRYELKEVQQQAQQQAPQQADPKCTCCKFFQS